LASKKQILILFYINDQLCHKAILLSENINPGGIIMVSQQIEGIIKGPEKSNTQSFNTQGAFVPHQLMQEFCNIMSQCMALLDEAPVVLQPTANQEGFWISDSKASRIWLLHQPGKS
jgi:hypothetical protein